MFFLLRRLCLVKYKVSRYNEDKDVIVSGKSSYY